MKLPQQKKRIQSASFLGKDLSEGWKSILLRNLVTKQKGKKPGKLDDTPWRDAVPYIDIEAFEKGNIRRYADPTSSVLINKGDVLVVWDGARCGHVGVAPMHGALGSTLMTIKPSQVLSEYLIAYLTLSYDLINSNPRGTGIPHVEPDLFWNLELPLAPIMEQKRIVAKVEELLTRVNAARERLAKVQKILKRFRQSVLDAACSGRLTADWREKPPNVLSINQILTKTNKSMLELATTPAKRKKVKEIYSYKEKENLDRLPDSWEYIALDKLCNSFQYGTSKKSKASGNIPVLRMGNIKNGRIDWTNLVYTSDDTEIKKYKLNSGDVLFNRTNSPELVGKTGIYKGEQPAIFAGYLIRINIIDELEPKYLNYCLNSPYAKEFCLRAKTDGVSQSNINAQKLGKFEVPFCSKEEQQEIPLCQ